MRRIMSGLIDIIKEHTLEPRNDKMLHFSSHLNHNRHTALYWWFGYPKIKSEPWANVLPLLQGTSIHEQIHKILSEDARLNAYHGEVPIVPEEEDFKYPWGGTADAFIQQDNKWTLIDYKTISGAGVTFLQEPRPEHIMQVSCYYHLNYWQPDNVQIMYLPMSQDYKRRWHEPMIYDVTPLPKQKILDRIAGVESDISIYASTRLLPPWPEGEYKWKQNKRNKEFELFYQPHYSSMFCPWRYLGDDDPCGCSQQKRVMIGKVDYERTVTEGDEETLLAYIDTIVE